MLYKKINDETLDFIYNKFQEYIEKRRNAIYYFLRMKMDLWEKERERDRRSGQYSGASIERWWNDCLKEADEWKRDCLRDIETTKQKFTSVFVYIRDKEFTEADCGYRYICNFHEGKIYKEIGPKPDQFTVKFSGEEWIYGWEPLPDEKITFYPDEAPKPYFTGLLRK